MGDESVVSANRELLAANLRDQTARAIVKRVGGATDHAALTDMVSQAVASRLSAIERELNSADADLA